MDEIKLQEMIGDENITVVEAMAKIDENAKGILFIVDLKEHLIGCATDGDIRRWLIKSNELNVPIVKAMKKTPKFLLSSEVVYAEQIMRRYDVNALPVVDVNNKIVDIILRNEKVENNIEVNEENLRDTPVIVMAGGKGTRLYPYTKILPKPLIPIGETPIIERILNEYYKYGIDEFYMTVNYKKGMIRSYFAELDPKYCINYVEEDRPLGTGGSIKLIKKLFDKPIFVTNCDALIRADYKDIYEYHRKSGNVITMIAALKNVTIPYGVLISGKNGELISMEEKPTQSYFVNTGMYVINPETISLIPDNQMFHMPQLVEKVMQQGGRVGTYPISEDSFLDMGEFGEMKRMEEKLHIVEN